MNFLLTPSFKYKLWHGLIIIVCAHTKKDLEATDLVNSMSNLTAIKNRILRFKNTLIVDQTTWQRSFVNIKVIDM